MAGLSRFFRVPEDDMLAALEILKRENLAQETRGTFSCCLGAFLIPAQFHNAALIKYYTQLLQDAAGAVQLPSSQRRFNSAVAQLSEEQLAMVINEMEALVKKFMNLGMSAPAAGRLYQMNLNVHAVSEELMPETFGCTLRKEGWLGNGP